MRKGKSSLATMNLWAQILCSGLIIFLFICFHAGRSTKHLRRPKVKRRDEESSPSDALTPKKRRTRLAGNIRTYLWVCRQLPPLNPIVLPTAFVNKNARIQQNGMNRYDTRYLLSSHLDAFG